MKPLFRLAFPILVFLSACSGETEPASMVAPPARDGFDSDSAFPGFTLVAPLQSARIYLVDMSGSAVHEWDTEYKSGVATYLTDRGTLLRTQRVPDHPTFQDAGGHGGRIQEIDWDGEVLWDFVWDSEKGLSHHDIEELPNGNVLFIAWDRTTRDWAIEHGRDPELLEGDEFWAGAVYEVKPTPPSGGEIVWSWHSTDHLIQNYDKSLPDYAVPRDHPEKIDINGDRDPPPPEEEQQQQPAAAADDEDDEEEDPVAAARRQRTRNADWMHANGIDYNAALDQIVISVRRFDEIWVIDHSTTTEEAKGPAGDLLYRWGNPFAYGMGEWEKRQLFGQHNARWIPEGHLGAGNLMIFNNGARPREHSSIDEWWAPHDSAGRYPRPEGQPWGPVQTEWSYAAAEPEDFFSSFISGAQRLPNGNTLICSGAQEHVFEVTPEGEVVWDWLNPFGPLPGEEEPDMVRFPNALFRVERYAADHPGIVRLREKGAQIPTDPGTGPPTNQGSGPPQAAEEEG